MNRWVNIFHWFHLCGHDSENQQFIRFGQHTVSCFLFGFQQDVYRWVNIYECECDVVSNWSLSNLLVGDDACAVFGLVKHWDERCSSSTAYTLPASKSFSTSSVSCLLRKTLSENVLSSASEHRKIPSLGAPWKKQFTIKLSKILGWFFYWFCPKSSKCWRWQNPY